MLATTLDLGCLGRAHFGIQKEAIRRMTEVTDASAVDYPVRHRHTSPVQLIGHGSSGTSIFADLCRKYLHVGFGTESQFVIRFYHRLPKYGDLASDANLRRLIADLHRERWYERCKKYGYASDAERIFSAIKSRTYRGVLDAVFGDLARHHGMPRWGDKSPEYVNDLPILYSIFPDAKYIHMVRDGRDVANSVMGRYWGPKNTYTAAVEWRDAIRKVAAFVEGFPKDQVLEVRYEDFLNDPLDVYAKLIEFLDIESDDGDLLEWIASQTAQDLVRTNFDKWKKAWPESQRLLYERVAGDELRRHGYETMLDGSDDQFGLSQRLYWRVENKLRKWTYRDYWKDNVYKVRLRLRNLFGGGN